MFQVTVCLEPAKTSVKVLKLVKPKVAPVTTVWIFVVSESYEPRTGATPGAGTALSRAVRRKFRVRFVVTATSAELPLWPARTVARFGIDRTFPAAEGATLR